MFQHKAIENLWNPVKFDSNMDDVVSCLLIKEEEFDEIVENLRKAQNFYLGKDDWLKRFRKGSSKQEILKAEDLPSLNMPYDNTTFWLERENDGVRVGINAIGPPGADAIFCRYIFNDRKYFQNSWYVWPVANLVYFDRPHLPQSERVRPVNLSQNNYEDAFYNYEMKHFDYMRRGYCLAILEFALTVLSCRNITYETVDPPEKVNKKRRKKGKEELVSYHVLRIAPMSPKKQTRSGVTGTGESPRVHLCRGHFKTYTEDAPLFGRYTGRFWWQPQVRGEKQKGIVHKDYDVEV